MKTNFLAYVRIWFKHCWFFCFFLIYFILFFFIQLQLSAFSPHPSAPPQPVPPPSSIVLNNILKMSNPWFKFSVVGCCLLDKVLIFKVLQNLSQLISPPTAFTAGLYEFYSWNSSYFSGTSDLPAPLCFLTNHLHPDLPIPSGSVQTSPPPKMILPTESTSSPWTLKIFFMLVIYVYIIHLLYTTEAHNEGVWLT